MTVRVFLPILFYLLTIVSMSSVADDGTIRRVRVPILMYHYVSPLPSGADDIRAGLTISPEQFRDHIAFLKSEGYDTVSLYEIDIALKFGWTLPEKPIILTFDDGYSDHYNYVYPVLKENNYTGTFFVITSFADDRNPNHLTWEQIIEMSQSGMNMESHTKSHHTLVNRDYNFLVWEISGSIESLESHTGHESAIFSFPVGRFDNNTLIVLDSTDIIRAVTTEYGTYHTIHDKLLSPRLRIPGNMGVAGLRNLLDTAP